MQKPDLEIPVPVNFTFGFMTHEPITLTCQHKLRPTSKVKIRITKTNTDYIAKSDTNDFDITCNKSEKNRFVIAIYRYLFSLFVNGYIIDLDESSKFII